MDPRDLELRNGTYAILVELGRTPSADEVARATTSSLEEVRAGWRRLQDDHALVLAPGGEELLMAAPFSAVPTPHRVQAASRSWYGNCAWDAFGICAALGTDGRIESSCPDCGERIEVEVREREPSDRDLLFHCLVPAANWWDDVAFT